MPDTRLPEGTISLSLRINVLNLPQISVNRHRFAVPPVVQETNAIQPVAEVTGKRKDCFMNLIIENLQVAGDLIAEAADLWSDLDCDRFVDAGGIGHPPTNPSIERLYTTVRLLEAILERIDSRD